MIVTEYSLHPQLPLTEELFAEVVTPSSRSGLPRHASHLPNPRAQAPMVRVRSTANGMELLVSASTAASMVERGDVELVAGMDEQTQAAYEAALRHHLSIHSIQRTQAR